MDWMRDMYTTNRIVLYLEAEATNLGPWINIFIILGGVKDYIIEIHKCKAHANLLRVWLDICNEYI